MRDKWRDVLAPLAQRQDFDRKKASRGQDA